MGICNNCDKDINLKEDEKICPNCNADPYICWNCQNGVNPKGHECERCGYIICDACKECGPDCDVHEHIQNIEGMTKREIVEYFAKVAKGLIRRTCPKGVPISYAKGKIRAMYIKINGMRTRDSEDAKEFKKRLEYIRSLPIEKEFTIKDIRSRGEHGYEAREVCNMSICFGIAQKITKTNKKGKEYFYYNKVDGQMCKHVDTKGLLFMRCTECKKHFKNKETHCDNCVYKKGPKKGQPRPLIESKSSVNFSQLARKKFLTAEIDGDKKS